MTKVQDDPAGSGGRYIHVTSPDGKFRTAYLHLSSVSVKQGDEVKEGAEIAKIGASANGKEDGGSSHIHYAIHKLNDAGVWVAVNPTEGGDEESKIFDPKKWIKKDPKPLQ